MADTGTALLDTGPGDPLELFDQAAELDAQIAAVDWSAQPLDTQLQATARSAAHVEQSRVVDAGVVNGLERSGEWAADGHKSATSAVAHVTNQSTSTARARVTRGRRMNEFDLVAVALLDGEIGADHARLILGADTPAVHDRLVEHEKNLIDAAKSLEYPDFVKAIAYWSQLADPDQADADAIDATERRRAHASWVGDKLRVDADMDHAGGAEFKNELERIEQRLFEADWADARERHGDTATKADLARTAEQRRCDALTEMARRSATNPLIGSAPKGRVVLNLHMDYPTFIAELARHLGLAYTYPEHRLCELDDGTPLVPSEALNLALGGEVRRIVFGADGHVLDYGKTRRLFTGALADAIRTRDRRCQMPGCRLPAAKCQIDHQIEAQHDGETSEANGECLCRFHNLWKTNHLTRYRTLRGWDP